MEHGCSPSDVAPGLSLASATGRPTDAERQALHERAAQARVAASEAIEHYVVLLAQSRNRLKMTEQQLVTVAATRAMVRDSVQRYAQLMKALATPPERMLFLVKETLRQQLPHPEYEDETKALVENVVTWCIEAYYVSSPAA